MLYKFNWGHINIGASGHFDESKALYPNFANEDDMPEISIEPSNSNEFVTTYNNKGFDTSNEPKEP